MANNQLAKQNLDNFTKCHQFPLQFLLESIRVTTSKTSISIVKLKRHQIQIALVHLCTSNNKFTVYVCSYFQYDIKEMNATSIEMKINEMKDWETKKKREPLIQTYNYLKNVSHFHIFLRLSHSFSALCHFFRCRLRHFNCFSVVVKRHYRRQITSIYFVRESSLYLFTYSIYTNVHGGVRCKWKERSSMYVCYSHWNRDTER